ncbi:M1 family metallopeptidase [Actinoplanes sp. NPDC051411]|uniref:M1 family metallopeptidase n=1 Tax=Actinoplanes sp. NPDC051411 TaxID=3155522 RepID=UPI0034125CA2
MDGCTSKPSDPLTFVDGAKGIGDAYLPTAGNGGYDVAGYDLALKYDPESGQLEGTATITATATENLRRFDLDLAHLSVQSVVVDNLPATSDVDGDELVVTPSDGIRRGGAMTVVVAYSGKPAQLRDPDIGGGGWLRTPDGAIALGQPQSASTWYPVNDHPADKATFKLAMTVPDGLKVISNGVAGPPSSSGGWTTWNWSEASPMASYLSTVVIGNYRVETSTHDGKPMVIAVANSLPADGPAARSVDRTGEIADFLAGKFGPYPFDAYGAIVVDDSRIGYALETQTRPAYASSFFNDGPDPTVVAHELAHQWFGDSVALERWKDIWLNEGFATYAEWLWTEHSGGATVAGSFDQAYNGFHWGDPPGDPGVSRLFGDAVYQRGAMTVYALREAMGDEAFGKLLTTWTSTHRDGNGTTAEMKSLASSLSGKNLEPLFQAWLYGKTKPPHP